MSSELRVQRVPTRRPASVALAWLATLASTIAAAWDGIIAALGGPPAEYDPIISLTWLTVVGLTWSTYLTRETLEHSRQSTRQLQSEEEARAVRHRESVATALLAELFSISARLRNLAQSGPSAATADFIAHPALERALRSPEVFRAETIHALAATLRRLKDVSELLREHPRHFADSRDQVLSPDQRQAAENRRVETQQGIRIRATWGFNWAVELVRLLNEEGGRMPSGLDEQTVNMFATPQLKADPFTRTLPPTGAGA